jgi:PAS domain S-box-containing protein
VSTVPGAVNVDSYTSVPRRWLIAAAVTLGLLGLFAFVGWSVDFDFLFQPLDGFPPFRPHFALGLVSSGIAFWALANHRRTVSVAAALVLVALGLTATMGIVWDRWPLDRSPVIVGESGPALARGLILVLSGLAVLLTVWTERWNALWNVVGLLGVTVLALSVMMFIARLVGLVHSVDNPMSLLLGASPQMIAGAFIVGLVFTRAAWRDVGFNRIPPAWVPWASGVAAAVALVLLWRALLLNESVDLRHVVQASTSAAAARIAGPIESALVTIDQAARRTQDPTRPDWLREASGVFRTPIGLAALATADSGGGLVALIVPNGAEPLDRGLLERRLAEMQTATWPDRQPRYLPLGRYRFAVAVPIYAADHPTGYVVGLINLQTLLPSDIADSSRFGFRLAFGGTHAAGDERPEPLWLERADLYTSTPTGRLAVWPRTATINTMRSHLPNVVFAFGLAVVILLPLAIQLGRTAWNRARVIERGQLSAVLERGTDGVWEMDLARDTIRPSPNLWRHLGYDPAALPIARETWLGLIHPDDRPRYQTEFRASLTAGADAFELQYRIRAADESWHWLVDRGRVAERDGIGHPVRMLGIIGDVTERRQIEEARQASEQRYRATFESAFQFQALLAPDGTCLDINRTALSYAGTTLGAIRGRPFWTTPWWSDDAESRRQIEAACRSAALGQIQRLEVEAAGEESSRVVLDLSIKPLPGADGTVEQLLVEGRDLTERKRAEKLLREVEVLATMGRVAAKVAHEINNPLAGIQNSFLLIKDAIPPSHPHIRYVGAIEREIGRISAVTRQLYETFRPERNGSGEPLDVVITDTVGLIRQLNRNSDVQIVTDLHKGMPEGAVPAAIIRQAVYNLVQNAVDASPPGGEITVTTLSVDGGYELRVRDRGPGIPAVVRERIFDPFYTTKPHSLRPGGMGLGLYLVRRSVEALGGTVHLVSPPDGGTEFIIWFPTYRSSIAGVDA